MVNWGERRKRLRYGGAVYKARRWARMCLGTNTYWRSLIPLMMLGEAPPHTSLPRGGTPSTRSHTNVQPYRVQRHIQYQHNDSGMLDVNATYGTSGICIYLCTAQAWSHGLLGKRPAALQFGRTVQRAPKQAMSEERLNPVW